MSDKTENMMIRTIKNGTVIDHIDSNRAIDVVKILNLTDEHIIVGMNLKSKRMGKKGVLKVQDKELSAEELNKIAFVSQDATIVIIKDYNVTNKYQVEVPDMFINIAKCANINCITNHQDIKTEFVTKSKNPILVTCSYCEKTSKNDLELL